jgi:adenylate cyclase, class 2
MMMNATGTEIEAKFLVSDLKKIEARLHKLEAQLIQPRTLETNLRFDLPDASLRKSFRVLRLRQEDGAILTYKGPGKVEDGIRAREEWEVKVSNFLIMKKILESLGYSVEFIYEKFRTTYQVGPSTIMLDELPMGYFVEIEGEDNETILSLARKLHLDPSAAISESYQALFEKVHKRLDLPFSDLTFENFADRHVEATDVGEKPADS